MQDLIGEAALAFLLVVAEWECDGSCGSHFALMKHEKQMEPPRATKNDENQEQEGKKWGWTVLKSRIKDG